MKIKRQNLEEILDLDFQVFALYTDIEDYRLAFLLNQFLGIHLVKTEAILEKKTNSVFPVFEFEEVSFYRHWYLLNNYDLVEKEVKYSNDLFTQSRLRFQQKTYFVKELKHTRYLLKIRGGDDPFYQKILKKILKIPHIYTCEIIPLAQNIKKIQHL